MAKRLSRRTLVAGGVGAVVAGIGVPLALRGGDRTQAAMPGRMDDGVLPTSITGDARPISMAMHIHGSFSEGRASMAAHLTEATNLGVDVIWWTDHDFRVSALGYQTAIGFDGPQEDQGPIWWKWTEDRAGSLVIADTDWVSEPHSPNEAGRALRLSAVGPSVADGELWQVASAWNLHYRTSLADTAITLDLLGMEIGRDARLAIELTTSHHPKGELPAGQRKLRYEFGGVTARRTQVDGLRATVALPLPPGAWQTVRLEPVKDFAEVFPDVVAADNSMFELRVGVLSRNGSAATGVFDRLRIDRARRADALALRDELIDLYRSRFPDVVQISALEVSLTRHLNWFGGELRLPDYGDRLPIQDPSLAATKDMAKLIQSHGGLASYNHPLRDGANNLAAELIAEHALGCDMVEIGYKSDLGTMLKVLDATARNAVLYTATGVTDDHEGDNWLHQTGNYLTHVWAQSTATDDLCRPLKAGQAWFGDPAAWRGALDIRLPGAGTSSMGAVLAPPPPRVDLVAVATDLPASATVDIVIGRVDYAGANWPVPAIVETRSVAAKDIKAGVYGFTVEPGPGSYVRLQVRVGSKVVAVGNPLWLLPRPPQGGVPGYRMSSS